MHTQRTHVSSYGLTFSWWYLPKYPSVSNSGWLCPVPKITLVTQRLFPCHKTWLVSSGHQLLPSSPAHPSWLPLHPLLLLHMPSVYFSIPAWPCSRALWPLLSPRIPSNFKSGPKLAPPSMAPGSGHGHTGYHWVVRLSCSATLCETECVGHSRRVCGDGTGLRCCCSASVSIFSRPALTVS